MSGKGNGLATGTERPSGTHSSIITGQSAPEDGRRPAIGPEYGRRPAIGPEYGRRPAIGPDESAQIRDSSVKAGQSVPAAGKRSASDPERSNLVHKGEPPGQSESAPDDVAWTACTAQPLDRPFGPSYFIPGRVEGKPVLCLIDTGCTTNLLGKHVFDRLQERLREQLVE